MQLGSETVDLRKIFKKYPEHINREFVFPARVKSTPVYIAPEIHENTDLIHFLESLVVTIITPDSIDTVKQKVQQETIQILQSCFENGRVLEAPIKILIGNIEYTVVAKGIGTTKFYRDTGAITPFMFLEHATIPEEEKASLKQFPFYEHGGTYRLKYALEELERSKLLEEMNIDVEKVLGIFEIEAVMGKDGEYVSIQELEKSRVITPGLRPVILIRAHKSNFRLLDPIILDVRKRNESIAPLFAHIVEEAEKQWGVSNIDGYLQKLIHTILSNRLQLIGKFETLNGEFWQDVFRNFSIFGEELDLGTMKAMNNNFFYTNPHHFVDHYKSELKTIFVGFRRLVEIIEKNTPHTIDHNALADIIYNTIFGWVLLHKQELRKYYDENDWQRWEIDFHSFMSWLFKACMSSFLNYIPSFDYEKILNKRVRKTLGYSS